MTQSSTLEQKASLGGIPVWNFLEKGEELLGTENYQLIGHTIWDAYQASIARLPLLTVPHGFKVFVAQLPEEARYVAAKANSAKNSFLLLVDATETPEYLLEKLPLYVEHEIAHLAHSQQNPGFWESGRSQSYLLAGAIREGIATYAQKCLDPDYFPDEVIAYEGVELRRLRDGVVDIMLYSPDDPVVSLKDFQRYGTDASSANGYEIGHYVVAHTILQREASLIDLMRMTLDDYAKVAEKL